MPQRNIIRVAEFEKLYYNEDRPFKEKHWAALCKYQEGQNRQNTHRIEFFRVLDRGIQFTNYVGVIQAGNLTIEVLPKTDWQEASAANTTIDKLEGPDFTKRQRWHNVLLQMLKECRLLEVNHVENARLNLKSNSILEIYLELFLSETEKLLHQGLVKKYMRTEGDILSMKGQMQFSKQISHNLIHRERFYVKHSVYNRINIFNQILYKTLCLIQRINYCATLTDKLNRLLLDFPPMPDCNIQPNSFDRLIYDRKTLRYKEAMQISKLLLFNYRPDISGGDDNVLAILFDMNRLWEEFVYRRLVRSCNNAIEVSRQNSRDFWYNTDVGTFKKIRPDIVLRKGSKTIILDTKWKIIKDNRPADEDLKQLFVYNLVWDASHSLLVYPGNLPQVNGSYKHFNLSLPKKRKEDEIFYNHCSLLFLTVLSNEGNLSKALGDDLLKSIERILEIE